MIIKSHTTTCATIYDTTCTTYTVCSTYTRIYDTVIKFGTITTNDKLCTTTYKSCTTADKSCTITDFCTHYDRNLVPNIQNCVQDDDFDTNYDRYCDQDYGKAHTISDFGTHYYRNTDRVDDGGHTIKHLNNVRETNTVTNTDTIIQVRMYGAFYIHDNNNNNDQSDCD